MLEGATTEEAEEYIYENSNLSRAEAEDLFLTMTRNPEMFSNTTLEELLGDYQYYKTRDSLLVPTEEIPDIDTLLPDSYGEDRKFNIGCRYKGVYSIKSFENERVFIPSSDYCYLKCINRFIQLASKSPEKTISTKYFSPYTMTIKQMKLIISGILVKCPNNCPIKNEYAYPGKSCSKECVKSRLERINRALPDIYKVKYDKQKGKVVHEIMSKGKPICKNYGIGLCRIKGNDYHAILLKNPTTTTYTKEDITFEFTQDITLNVDFTKNKRPLIPEKDHKICISYDIETFTKNIVENGKEKKELVPYALGYEVIDLEKMEVISEYKEIIINNENDNLFNVLFKELDEDNLIPDKTQIFAHNGGKFDNKYAMNATNVTYEKIISKGGFIKQLVLLSSNKKKIIMKDTLPFVLMPLKDACKALRTTIKKLDFDIVDKSFSWYEEHKNSKDPETDWRQYLKNDVQSLSQVIIKLEQAYNKFATSILWYTGLAGIGYHITNNYCFGMKKLYVPKDPSMVQLIKDSMYGGRVIQWKRFYEMEPGSEGMISIDMNSLYPSAMWMGAYPYGKPKELDGNKLDIIADYIKNDYQSFIFDEYPHFIVEVVIKIPNIRYAYHPYKTEEGTLIYPSNRVITGVYNDIDLREMIRDGYELLEVKKGIYFRKSKRIFTSLIQQLYELRNYYKSLPPDHPERPMEYVIKIILNAIYGKFNETIRGKNIFRDEDFEQDFSNEGKIEKEYKLSNGQKEIAISLFRHMVSKPTYIGAYVLSYSRAIVNEIIRTVKPENIYYSDTDSLYLEKRLLTELNLPCSSELGGFKNDYGDNMVITRAIFLDMKRYYLEMEDRSKLPPQLTFKAKFNGLSFKAISSIQSIKYKHVNYNKLSSVKQMEMTRDLYMTMLDQHNKRISSPYNIETSNLTKEQKLENKKKQREWEKTYIDELKIMTEFWNKKKDKVLIEGKELKFQIDPNRRGNWVNNEFYSIGFDRNSEEFKELYHGKIGDIKRECSKIELVSYSFYFDKEKQCYALKSYRPLMYSTESLYKDKKFIVHPNIKAILTTLYLAYKKIDDDIIEDIIYLDPEDKDKKSKLFIGYTINAFGRLNPFRYENKDELPYDYIFPLIAIRESEDNIKKYGRNMIPEKELENIIINIAKQAPFKK